MAPESIAPRAFNQCPQCRGLNTHRRRGVHFEHERICSACNHCWDPVELWSEEERERLALNTYME